MVAVAVCFAGWHLATLHAAQGRHRVRHRAQDDWARAPPPPPPAAMPPPPPATAARRQSLRRPPLTRRSVAAAASRASSSSFRSLRALRCRHRLPHRSLPWRHRHPSPSINTSSHHHLHHHTRRAPWHVRAATWLGLALTTCLLARSRLVCSRTCIGHASSREVWVLISFHCFGREHACMVARARCCASRTEALDGWEKHNLGCKGALGGVSAACVRAAPESKHL